MRKGSGVWTTGMIAKLCGVANRTVTKWIDGGGLKAHRIAVNGNKAPERRVYEGDLIHFLQASGQGGALAKLNGTFVMGSVLFVGEPSANLVRATSAYVPSVTVVASPFVAGLMVHQLKPALIVFDVGSLGRGLVRSELVSLRQVAMKARVAVIVTEDDGVRGEWVPLGADEVVGADVDDARKLGDAAAQR